MSTRKTTVRFNIVNIENNLTVIKKNYKERGEGGGGKGKKRKRAVHHLGVVSLLVSAHRIVNLVLCAHTGEVPPTFEINPILVESINLGNEKDVRMGSSVSTC